MQSCKAELLVGYGTLLFRASLGDTIGSNQAQGRGMQPVVVKGLKRLFNLRPSHYEASAKLANNGIENGAMNVVSAPGHKVNGLAFTVLPSELADLDRRERYYDRLSVEVFDFESGEFVSEGGIYSASSGALGVEHDPARLLPLWRDVVWARSGAYSISRAFGESFDRTTFLADGVTLVVDRYREFLVPGQPPSPEEVDAVSAEDRSKNPKALSAANQVPEPRGAVHPEGHD